MTRTLLALTAALFWAGTAQADMCGDQPRDWRIEVARDEAFLRDSPDAEGAQQAASGLAWIYHELWTFLEFGKDEKYLRDFGLAPVTDAARRARAEEMRSKAVRYYGKVLQSKSRDASLDEYLRYLAEDGLRRISQHEYLDFSNGLTCG